MPTASARRHPPRDTLNLRIKADERLLIDRAAEMTGKTRTDFVLDAARKAAEEAVLDRTLFLVDEERFAAFKAALDASARPNERLIKTMQTRPRWEKPE